MEPCRFLFSILHLIHILVTCAVCKPSCPVSVVTPGSTDQKEFTLTRGAPYHEKPTCLKHYTKLFCCAINYKAITWYKRTGDEEDPSYQLVAVTRAVYTEEKNQSLVIEKAVHNNTYRCVIAEHSGKQHSYDITLNIFDCGIHSGPPHFLGNDVLFKGSIGGHLRVSCPGYFGTRGDLSRNYNAIMWVKEGKSLSEEFVTPNPNSVYDPRVTIKMEEDENNEGIFSSELEISDIKESDFGIYQCILYNGHILGDTRVNFTVIKIATEESVKHEQWMGYPAIYAAICLVVLITVVGVLFYFWLDIKLTWILVTDRLGLVKDAGDRVYDAFILYNEDSVDDYEFTREHLKQQLENKYNYSVCLSHRDFEPGDVKVNNYLNTLKKSHCMILVMSPEFIKDDWCVFTALQSLNMMNHPSLIFIHYKRISNKHWLSMSQTSHQISDQSMLRSAMKLGYKVTWPEQKDITSRKFKRFWKQIRVKMPAMPKEKRQDVLHIDIPERHFHEPLIPSERDSLKSPGTALTILGSPGSEVIHNPLAVELKSKAKNEAIENAGI